MKLKLLATSGMLLLASDMVFALDPVRIMKMTLSAHLLVLVVTNGL
ncbi:hypothetical protein [Pseudoalteromonas luteoviolacea]|uniref:Uncharacterized protein n=1 Tax=Pseudoalteromonas luteoviolacea NCIMB 1942 TaxID=1365253 RepID=A0A166Y299_9GAMM|nr:hypothetical protein [Pseudoalteromonas luteoviolacea]KZN41275.1 hypothetical protein N482_20670 [Pseudoalteromonas luteoviolacea NCIMB 1942]